MKVLVTGAGGQLGHDVVAVCAAAGDDVVATGHAELDVTVQPDVAVAVASIRPDVVIHSAAWTAVDACEGDPDRAFTTNADSGAMGARGERARRCPSAHDQHRLRVRRNARSAVPRPRHNEPAVGLRPFEARRRARGRPGRDGRAHVVGVRPARFEHGAHRDAPRRRTRHAVVRRRPARMSVVHRRSGADAAPARVRASPRHSSRHQPGRGELVRVRAQHRVGDGEGPGDGPADQRGRPRPATPRPRDRPTACSTTRPFAKPACPSSATTASRSSSWLPG